MVGRLRGIEPLDELVVAGKTLAVSLFTIRYSVSGISNNENPPLTVEYQISIVQRRRQLISGTDRRFAAAADMEPESVRAREECTGESSRRARYPAAVHHCRSCFGTSNMLIPSKQDGHTYIVGGRSFRVCRPRRQAVPRWPLTSSLNSR